MQIRSRDPYSPIPLLTFSRSDWLLPIVATITTRDALQKQKMKIYADQKGNAQERKITPGEVVLMK